MQPSCCTQMGGTAQSFCSRLRLSNYDIAKKVFPTTLSRNLKFLVRDEQGNVIEQDEHGNGAETFGPSNTDSPCPSLTLRGFSITRMLFCHQSTF